MEKFGSLKFLVLLYMLTTFCTGIHAGNFLYPNDSSGHKRQIGPAFDFDGRFSFISQKSVFIWGSRFGIFINNKFKIGIGGYFLNDILKDQPLEQGGPQTYSEYRKLRFATLYFEPFLFRSKFWELSIPVEAGYGKSKFRYYSNTTDMLEKTASNDFIPLEAGLSLSFKFPPLKNFKPIRWIGINGMIGYRYCVLDDIFKVDYDGLFWSVSITFLVDRITEDCHFWKEQRRQRESKKDK